MIDAVSDVPKDGSFENRVSSIMIRAAVREVVEDALARAPGRADTRREVRSAAERLGNALVAHADAANQPGTQRGLHATSTTSAAATVADESGRRRRAFRVMAGVRE
jgi:hypothetical protein